MSTEENRSRRMWAIINGELELAPEGDHRGHLQWFNEKGWVKGYDFNPVFEKIVRGFYRDGNLVGYTGRDMEHWGVAQAFAPMLNTFADRLRLAPDCKVWAGAQSSGRGDDTFVGRHLIGTLEDMIRYEEDHADSNRHSPRSRRRSTRRYS